MDLIQNILQGPEIQALLSTIITAVFSALGVWLITLVTKAKDHLVAKTSVNRVNTLKEIAMTIVRYIDQTMKETGNDVKLKTAIDSYRKAIDDTNIKVGDKELIEYIEEAVNVLRTTVETGLPTVQIDKADTVNAVDAETKAGMRSIDLETLNQAKGDYTVPKRMN